MKLLKIILLLIAAVFFSKVAYSDTQKQIDYLTGDEISRISQSVRDEQKNFKNRNQMQWDQIKRDLIWYKKTARNALNKCDQACCKAISGKWMSPITTKDHFPISHFILIKDRK